MFVHISVLVKFPQHNKAAKTNATQLPPGCLCSFILLALLHNARLCFCECILQFEHPVFSYPFGFKEDLFMFYQTSSIGQTILLREAWAGASSLLHIPFRKVTVMVSASSHHSLISDGKWVSNCWATRNHSIIYQHCCCCYCWAVFCFRLFSSPLCHEYLSNGSQPDNHYSFAPQSAFVMAWTYLGCYLVAGEPFICLLNSFQITDAKPEMVPDRKMVDRKAKQL